MQWKPGRAGTGSSPSDGYNTRTRTSGHRKTLIRQQIRYSPKTQGFRKEEGGMTQIRTGQTGNEIASEVVIRKQGRIYGTPVIYRKKGGDYVQVKERIKPGCPKVMKHTCAWEGCKREEPPSMGKTLASPHQQRPSGSPDFCLHLPTRMHPSPAQPGGISVSWHNTQNIQDTTEIHLLY